MAKEKLLIGAHMSISGGVFNALLCGQELECTTIQIFTKNNNQWKAKELFPEDVKKFFENQKTTGISPVVGHNGYLINLASPKDNVYDQSKESMLVELKRAELLGLPYLVMHPGSHLGKGEKEGIKKIVRSIDWLHQKTKGFKVKILLETTAGQGSAIGHRFEHLAEIIERVKDNERLGVCYDTCHTFAAGYDIRTKKAYQATFKEFDNSIGLNRLGVIHVNDSLKDLGSRVDRHQHIGEGKIGLEGFRLLMNDKRWEKIPKILETPKGEGAARDIKNLNLLKSLVKWSKSACRDSKNGSLRS
ncbi:MAG: endonuclease IV [candidate division Zixibacteria bacterium SM23_73_3]|nr:MAG: endonuclease IV [candidate division Zixibacteria bacterium SM23_73_3]